MSLKVENTAVKESSQYEPIKNEQTKKKHKHDKRIPLPKIPNDVAINTIKNVGEASPSAEEQLIAKKVESLIEPSKGEGLIPTIGLLRNLLRTQPLSNETDPETLKLLLNTAALIHKKTYREPDKKEKVNFGPFVSTLRKNYDELLKCVNAMSEKLGNIISGSFSNQTLGSFAGQSFIDEDTKMIKTIEEQFIDFKNRGEELEVPVKQEIAHLNSLIENGNQPKVPNQYLTSVSNQLRYNKDFMQEKIDSFQSKQKDRIDKRNNITNEWNLACQSFNKLVAGIDLIQKGSMLIPPVKSLADEVEQLMEFAAKLREDTRVAKVENIKDISIRYKNLNDELQKLNAVKKDLSERFKKIINNLEETITKESNSEVDSAIFSSFLTYDNNLKEIVTNALKEIKKNNNSERKLLHDKLVKQWNNLNLTLIKINGEIEALRFIQNINPQLLTIKENLTLLHTDLRGARNTDKNYSSLRQRLFLGTDQMPITSTDQKPGYKRRYDTLKNILTDCKTAQDENYYISYSNEVDIKDFSNKTIMNILSEIRDRLSKKLSEAPTLKISEEILSEFSINDPEVKDKVIASLLAHEKVSYSQLKEIQNSINNAKESVSSLFKELVYELDKWDYTLKTHTDEKTPVSFPYKTFYTLQSPPFVTSPFSK